MEGTGGCREALLPWRGQQLEAAARPALPGVVRRLNNEQFEGNLIFFMI